MPQQSNLGEMIQMISALSQIQNQRRQLNLDEERHKTSVAQFAQQMGFQEKSQEYKKFADAIDLFARQSAEARKSAGEMGAALFPNNPQMAQALQHFALSAPETVESLRNTAATAGYRNPQGATPQQLEAANVATTGMNQGQMAQSGMAQQAVGMMNPQMMQGAAQRMATGQTPMQAAIESIIQSNPGMLRAMAGQAAGTQLSAAQQAQNALGYAGVNAQMAGVQVNQEDVRQRAIANQMDIAAKLATARAQGGLSPAVMDGFTRLGELNKQIADPKANEETRKQAMAMYNVVAQQIGHPELMWGANAKPGPEGFIGRTMNSIYNPNTPPPQMNYTQPIAPPQFAPPQAPFMQTQPNNSLQSFLQAFPPRQP